MSKPNKNLLRYKLAALIGTVIMAVGSFMACLSTDPTVSTLGNVLLVASIVISAYGYAVWQP